jgi:DNA-directed RNA polymerase specialized sigma24 family protein
MRYRSILGEQDAEDVIHNVFLKLPKEARSYKGKHNVASAKTWLYTIVRSEAMIAIAQGARPLVDQEGR